MCNIFNIYGIPDSEQLYILGNGFDIHHGIKSNYSDFRKWLLQNNQGNIIDMMDIFFSNERDFWGGIENALGEYREESITEWCEPNDSIPDIFGGVMEKFKAAFNEWVDSIDIGGIQRDLQLPKSAKYLTFNYTDTLESEYGIPSENILHIHGSRIVPGDEYIIGHGNYRDPENPFLDESVLLPYQNAYSEVVTIMNGWKKEPQKNIRNHDEFFKTLNKCKGICIFGFSYNSIDMPYLEEIVKNVDKNCRWVLTYYNDNDRALADKFAKDNMITNDVIIHSDSHVMDYTKVYRINRKMALSQGVEESQYDKEEILYYDETDNVKHLVFLPRKELNAGEDTCFVLGGIQAEDNLNEDELRFALGKPKTKELKSTKDIKGNFSQIMRKETVSRCVDLVIEKGWHIHFVMVQIWYYGFVDIVDSINTNASLAFPLKATLYRILTLSPDDTVGLLGKYHYPNIKDSDKAKLIKGLIALTDRYLIQCTNKIHYKLAVIIRQLLEESKGKELIFIQDEISDVWVARFNQFYKSEIYSYPQKTLVFDEEKQIEKTLKEEVIVVEGEVLSNFKFADSKTTPMIQVSDYIVAILKKYFVFLDRSYQEVKKELDVFDAIQMDCFKKLIWVLKISLEYNPMFFHYIANIEMIENFNRVLKEYSISYNSKPKD